MRRTYVGYDLGDDKTMVDVVTLEAGNSISKTIFENMTMPGTINPGQAMPTLFAFGEDGAVVFSNVISTDPEYVHNITAHFKKRPSALLLPSKRTEFEQITLLKDAVMWPDPFLWKEGNGIEMLCFKKAIIAFTDAIFSDSGFANALKAHARNSDEIIFCVGHPTDWSELDIAIYELILKSSILGAKIYQGIKSKLLIEREAVAILNYFRNVEWDVQLSKDHSVLIVDVGASTVEITAISHKIHFYADTDRLGARSIDFMIRDWYLNRIKQYAEALSIYPALTQDHSPEATALTLSCRRAREQLYSSPSKLSIINFGVFPGIRLTEKDLDQILETTPIANLLRETIPLDNQEGTIMGNKPWKILFKEFLIDKKQKMAKQGIHIGYIILTGGASKMDFVARIVSEVFDEIPVPMDLDPTRSVSKGLALTAAEKFQL